MELRQLEYFMMLCEELHFTRAAEKLHIAQPTLSQQIKILEQEMGVLLFNRIGKKISMTVAGQLLYTQSLTIFQTLQNTKLQLQELGTLQKGMLRIGASPGELTDFVSSALLSFVEQYPAIQVSVLSTDDVYTQLKENKIDLGFSFSPLIAPHTGQFCEVPLFMEPLYFVVHREHPLATRDFVELPMVAREKLVLFPSQHLCRKLIDRTVKEQQLMLNIALETASVPTIFQFVEKQMGGTIVARTLYEQYKTPKLVAKPIASPELVRETVLIYQKDMYMPQAVRGFIPLLLKQMAQYELNVFKEGKEQLTQL